MRRRGCKGASIVHDDATACQVWLQGCHSSCSRGARPCCRGRAAALVSLSPCADLFEQLGIEVLPMAPLLLRAHDTADVTLTYRYDQTHTRRQWQAAYAAAPDCRRFFFVRPYACSLIVLSVRPHSALPHRRYACRPQARQRLFQEPLVADVAGVRMQLGNITGCCTGALFARSRCAGRLMVACAVDSGGLCVSADTFRAGECEPEVLCMSLAPASSLAPRRWVHLDPSALLRPARRRHGDDAGS